MNHVSHTLHIAGLATTSLFAFSLIWFASVWGIGLTPDSLHYIAAASSFREKFSLEDFSTHWPPLYPVVLAMVSTLTSSVLEGARWLQAVIAALQVLAMAGLAGVLTGGHRLSMLLAASFVALSPVFFEINARAWSEGLFVSLQIAALTCLLKHLQNHRTRLLILSASLAALAFAARYAGIAFIAFACCVLFMEKNSLGEKFRIIVIYASLGMSLGAFWLLYSFVEHGTFANREIIFNELLSEKSVQLLKTVARWFFFREYGHVSLVLILMCAAFFTISASRLRWRHPISEPRLLVVFYLLFYALFIVFSVTFVDASIPLGNRILYPAYLLLFVVLIASIPIWRKHSTRVLLSVAFVAGLMLPQITSLKQSFQQSARYGIGFASRFLVELPVWKVINSMPADRLIYTNSIEMMYLYAHHLNFKGLPFTVLPTLAEANAEFSEQHRRMIQELFEQNGLIVYFKILKWRTYVPALTVYQENPALEVLYQEWDAAIFSPGAADLRGLPPSVPME